MGDRPQGVGKVDSWEHHGGIQDSLPMFLVHVNELAIFLSSHVSEIRDGHAIGRILSKFVNGFALQHLELGETVIVNPLSAFNTFAELDQQVGAIGPVTAKSNLKQRANNTSGILTLSELIAGWIECLTHLCNECSVRNESKIVDVDVGDMRLEQDIDFVTLVDRTTLRRKSKFNSQSSLEILTATSNGMTPLPIMASSSSTSLSRS